LTERRWALKVCYVGGGFSGSQRQPDLRTVEGKFLTAFDKLDIEYSDFRAAGRTDRGVSALGAVFALTADSQLIKPRILNSWLPLDIRVTAVQKVEFEFNPRHALERVYKYFLADEDYDLDSMQRASEVFIGEHSFHNFSVADARNPIRRINSVEIEKKEGVFILTFAGESFLWQMVRRMTTALKMVGCSEISAAELGELLYAETEKKIAPAPPENLVLWDVRYDFKFNPENYTQRLIESVLKKSLAQINSQKVIYTEALKEVEKSN